MVKVSVGNLAFKTTEPELAEAFKKAGNVLSVNIITRGRRSLGYGFVEFESEADAEKAVQLMDKQELEERQINVEVAKPREDLPEGSSQGDDEPAPRKRTRGAPRGGFAGSTRGGAGAGTGSGTGTGFRGRGGSFRGRGRGGARGGRRPPKSEEDTKDRIPSKTTLFVSNLPFSIDHEGLEALFKGHNVKSAHVVETRNGRSRGYGFVEFNNEEDQQKALQALDGFEVQGAHGQRPISVRVATSDQREKATGENGTHTPEADEKKEDE